MRQNPVRMTLALTSVSGKRPSVFYDDSKRQPPAFASETISQADRSH